MCTILIVIFYGSFKTRALVGRDDFTIQRFVEESYFENTARFGFEDGFVLAASITDEDENYRPKQ